jgi:integrase/recombinase XerC
VTPGSHNRRDTRDDTAPGPGSPAWFEEFLADRGTRKPSAHTMKAYRQDFFAIATLLNAAGGPAHLDVADITKDSMRAAFAAYARTHEPASIRRCWSSWNVLCTYLFTSEKIGANPMLLVGRPKPSKTLPKALPQPAVSALVTTVARERDSPRRTHWAERDLALILTALLAGLTCRRVAQCQCG